MPDAVSWSLHHLPRLTGRTAVVTGANSGIGLEASRGLAALGARVVMACRSEERAEAAAVDIHSTVPGADLVVRRLDLADLSSVAAFAETFAETDRLDLLVNNAGLMAPPVRQETADGFEMQFGVNVLGHFALTARLLPHLLRAPAARAVWLSSIAHRRGRIRLDDLQSEGSYSPFGAYQQSKLADLMLAIEMQRRLTDSGADVLSVAAHPGLTNTDLSNDMAGGSRLKARILAFGASLIAMPIWKGALPTLVAAAGARTQPADYIGPDGFQETRGMPARATIAPQAQDAEVARRLWTACEELTGVSMLS